MTKLFVYGTLKRAKCNNNVMGEAVFIKEDCLKGFKMHSLGGFPALTEEPFDKNNEHPRIVHGELYEVNDYDMVNINRLEGYDADREDNPFYERTSVVLESGEQALVFYMTECDRPLVENGLW